METAEPILIPGRHGDPFARDLSRWLGLSQCAVEFVEFTDDAGPRSGETRVRVTQNIRGRDVYVLWSVDHTNHELVTVLQLIDACRLSAGCRRITLVAPEFPYARQDKTHERRESLSSRLVARLLEAVGLDGVITVDLHSDQIEGHFRIPLDHLRGRPIWAHYIAQRYREWVRTCGLHPRGVDLVLGVPDAGRARGVRELSDEVGRNLRTGERKIKIPLAHHDKHRHWERPGQVLSHGLLGDVEGKVVWFTDDLLASGSTLFGAAAAAHDAGARHVVCSATHAHGFDRVRGDGIQRFADRLAASHIDELVVADTHPRFVERVRTDPLLAEHVTVLTLTPMIGQAIQRIRSGLTIKEMMRNIPEPSSLYQVVHRATGPRCLNPPPGEE